MRSLGIGVKRKSKLLVIVSLVICLGSISADAATKDKKKSSSFDFDPSPFVTRVKGAEESARSKEGAAKIDEQSEKIQHIPEDIDKPDVEELKSKDPIVYLKRAKVFAKHKMYKRALIAINKCLILSPGLWEAKYVGAYIYQMQGRTDEAIRRYRHLLKVKPGHVMAHINLGSLLRKRNQYDLAEKHYKKAVSLNYYSLKAHYNLANVLIDQHRLEEALKELKVCVKLKPNNAWVHNNLGVLYQKINYNEEAEEEFLKAMTLEPSNKKFVTNLKLLRSNKETYQAQADAADLL